MDQVFVINPKGGCGKTTISTQLAGYYASLGKEVLLADHDAQKSSSDWLASRPAECAQINSIALTPETSFDANGAEVVIHDMPAAWSFKHVHEVIKPGDRLIIPVLPSPTDIKACLRFVMGLYREGVMDANVSIGLVANKVKTNTRYFSILHEFLDKLDLPMVGQLRDTQNYIRLMDRGLSLSDLPESRVKRDIEQWAFIHEWLEIN